MLSIVPLVALGLLIGGVMLVVIPAPRGRISQRRTTVTAGLLFIVSVAILMITVLTMVLD